MLLIISVKSHFVSTFGKCAVKNISVGSPGKEVTNFNIFLLSTQQDEIILIKEKHTLLFTENLCTCGDNRQLRVFSYTGKCMYLYNLAFV